MRTSTILQALFPNTRENILTTVMLQPHREWFLAQLAAELHVRPSTLQREIEALLNAGLLRQRRDGRRLYLSADTASPIFPELRTLFEKTAGIEPSLKNLLAEFGSAVCVAFLYGSFARREERSSSDLDLMILGSLRLDALAPSLRALERRLRRPINPTLYSVDNFKAKLKAGNHFLNTVYQAEKIFLTGHPHELEAMVAGRFAEASHDQQAGA